MKPALVVMAAGVGSRYGGLKQIDPVGPSGEIMLDYSVFDAMRAGFERVVFIIRHDIEKDFKAIIGSHFVDRIKVDYVFQELSSKLPQGFSVPADRKKPWGTGHAILCCKEIVNEPFAVINADDFYGRESYKILYDYLTKLSNTSTDFCLVGYKLGNTLSPHGHVARGICEVDESGMLKSVVERLKIEKTADGARFEEGEGKWGRLTGEETASMNMFGFTPALFKMLEEKFPKFLEKAVNNPKAEFLMPSIADELIKEGKITMRVLKTNSTWFGVTYKEDKPQVAASIMKLIEAGEYPKKLWG